MSCSFGKIGGEVLEVRPPLGVLRVEAVDGLDPEQAVVLLGVLRLAHLAGDVVAGAQAEAADLRLRDVDVVRAGEQALAAQEAEAVVRRSRARRRRRCCPGARPGSGGCGRSAPAWAGRRRFRCAASIAKSMRSSRVRRSRSAILRLRWRIATVATSLRGRGGCSLGKFCCGRACSASAGRTSCHVVTNCRLLRVAADGDCAVTYQRCGHVLVYRPL